MNTKLYVLGAMLGAVPALMSECSPWDPPGHGQDGEVRGGASRQAVHPVGGSGAVALPPSPGAPGLEPGVPTHPCELITVMQVPCDPAAATCEYTYWECPESVTPLEA